MENLVRCATEMENLVKRALPNIEENTVQQVVDQLKAVGVDCVEDLVFVEEKYLENILRPIQIKKFLLMVNQTPSSSNSIIPTKEIINHMPLAPITMAAKSDWSENFEIPWNSFSKELLTACAQKKHCTKKSMADMIRVVTTQISKIDESPGRKNLRVIAQKIVSKYPDTFEDRCGDFVVAGGITTIMKKIENCLDNKKRLHSVAEKFDGEKKKKTTRNSYGTVNWQPKELPDGETKLTQLEHKEWLIEEYRKVDRDEEKVLALMETTYSTQRFFINGHPSSINAVRIEWPFIFEENCLSQHAKQLLNQDIDAIFTDCISSKAKQIYNLMSSKTSSPEIMKVLKEIEIAKEELQNLLPETFGIFPLLLAYFHEPIESLFKTNLEPVCKEDVEKNETCLTPYVATLCGNIYKSRGFVLVIDGVVVMHLTSFLSAVKAMFSSYYVFNIEYPENGHLTLEFMQRCLFNINPQRGSKVQKQKKTKSAVPAQIFKLVEELKNHNSLFQL